MSEKVSADNNKALTVGIVGAGRVGLQFYRLFSQGNHAQIAYVADREKRAPACEAALANGTPVFTDFREAISRFPTDFILEITGSKEIQNTISQALSGHATQLITHDMAFIMMKSIEDDNTRIKKDVSHDIQEIRNDIARSFEMMGATIWEIKKTMNNLRLLSLNARVEAARAGEAGRGFDIVAQSVEKTADDVHLMTENIEKVNEDISAVLDRINDSLDRLK